VIPIHLALPALAVSAALGAGLERALGGSERGDASPWPLRIACGLALVCAALLHPLVSLALLSIHVARARAGTAGASPPPSSALTIDRGAAVVLVVLGLAIVVRMPVPIYWDEHVWLAKVRLGPLALREAALDPAQAVIPRGYPIVASLAQSLFAQGRDDLGAITAGAAALSLLAASNALGALPARRALGWLATLATMPLVWIHLRSAYLDAVVGLLALALALALPRPTTSARHGAIATAFLLAGAKDEGLAHVIAIACAHVLRSDARRRALGEAAAPLGAGLLAVGSWAALRAAHGVLGGDHALDFAGFGQLGAIALELARALTDVLSFGLVWPFVLGAVAACSVTEAPRTRRLALTLTLQSGLLVGGLALGTENLVAFTLDGTVAPRLLVQLAPLAAWLCCEALVELPKRSAQRADHSPIRGAS
jgi:hypothetical protein